MVRVRVCTGMPDRVMMKSEGERLQTSRCSGLSGMKATWAGVVTR